MTPRENLSLLVSGASPQWIPFTLDIGGSEGFTTAIQRRFEQETGAKDPAEYFDYDFRTAELPGGSAAKTRGGGARGPRGHGL